MAGCWWFKWFCLARRTVLSDSGQSARSTTDGVQTTEKSSLYLHGWRLQGWENSSRYCSSNRFVIEVSNCLLFAYDLNRILVKSILKKSAAFLVFNDRWCPNRWYCCTGARDPHDSAIITSNVYFWRFTLVNSQTWHFPALKLYLLK